jgi:hypothetical protein
MITIRASLQLWSLSKRSIRCRYYSRLFSSQAASSSPLFLWLGESGELTTTSTDSSFSTPSSSLLLPVPPALEPTVFTPEDVLKLVNDHYSRQDQFVGGMGEDDLGVWFAPSKSSSSSSSSSDALDYADLVQQGIALVKQERHGVPFGLYTSGLVVDDDDATTIPLLNKLGLSSLQVSLFAASPPRSPQDFGRLCGFIVNAVEQGVAVEVGVLEQYATSARDLALSLGAQQVHVYEG